MSDAPVYSVTTERLYDRLPDVYRETDAANDYQFKKYLSSVADQLGDIDLLVERFRYRSQIELEFRARYSQRFTTYKQPNRVANAPEIASTSDIVDPRAADFKWLPWLGQLVGVYVDANTPDIQARDSIYFASTGYRAGSKDALEKAARTVLSGSRYAMALPQTKVDLGGSLAAGTVWDVTILTRADESPNSIIILNAVNSYSLKPAGVRLYHRTYTASWDALEASFPYWQDWETQVWDGIEQAGLTYAMPKNNILPNPSFEVNADGWTPSGAISITRVGSGGIDGAGYLRGDMSGTGFKFILSPAFHLDANVAYVYGLTYRSTVACQLVMYDGTNQLNVVQLQPTGNNWARVNTGIIPSQTLDTYHLALTSSEGNVNSSLSIDAGMVRPANSN